VAEGFGRRAVKGSLWATFDGWATEALSLVVFLVLARLLGPGEFGLVAIALGFTAVAAHLTAYTTGEVLIQKQDLTDADCDAVFWVTVLAAGLLALVLALAAPAIGRLFDAAELASVIRWLCVVLVLQAFTTVPLALLTRELRFDVTARRSLVMLLGGAVTGIAMAVQGYGVWALVGQHLAGASLNTVLLLGATGWRPGLRAGWPQVLAIRRFVASSLGNSALQMVDERAPQLLVGFLLGPAAAGLMNVALRLVQMMQRLFAVPINQIAMPAFARLRDDPAALDRFRDVALSLGLAVSLPAAAGAAAIAPELIGLGLGEAWLPMVPVFQILCVGVAIWPVILQARSALYGLGRPERLLRVGLLDGVAGVIVILATAPFGLVAVALGLSLRILVWRWPLTARQVRLELGTGLVHELRLLLPPLLASLLVLLVFVALRLALEPVLGTWPAIVLAGLVAGLAYVVITAVLQRSNLRVAWALWRGVPVAAPA
jgi:PST family polysaccharide transporter